jgi:hypothetical protein
MRRLMRDGVFVAHLFTTLVMCGLCSNAFLQWMHGPVPTAYTWFGSGWPFVSLDWAFLLACSALGGIGGAFVLAGYFGRNKYLILASTTMVATGHAHVTQTIWDRYHLSSGSSTYSLVFLLSMWVFWIASSIGEAQEKTRGL